MKKIIAFLMLLVIILLGTLTYESYSKEKEIHQHYLAIKHRRGSIDCMPGVDGEYKKLCDMALEDHYENIVW